MKAQSVSQVERCIDLSGLGGSHQEFGQFGWFHIEDMLPLCRDFKRGAYAYVIRTVQPLIMAHAQPVRCPVAQHSLVQACTTPPNDQAAAEDGGHAVLADTTALATVVQQCSLEDVIAALVEKHGLAAFKRATQGVRGHQCMSSEERQLPNTKSVPDDDLQEAAQIPTQTPQNGQEEYSAQDDASSSGCSAH